MNSAGKLGAMMAATGAVSASRASTFSMADRTCLACWVHTRKQTPQPMHRSASTCALRSAIRIALAGHSRTHW